MLCRRERAGFPEGMETAELFEAVNRGFQTHHNSTSVHACRKRAQDGADGTFERAATAQTSGQRSYDAIVQIIEHPHIANRYKG